MFIKTEEVLETEHIGDGFRW